MHHRSAAGVLRDHGLGTDAPRFARRPCPSRYRFRSQQFEKNRAREPHRPTRQDPRAKQQAVHRKEKFPMKFRALAIAALLVSASSLFAAETFNVDKVHS